MGGSTALVIIEYDSSITREATKRLAPKGGVQYPSPRFIARITPKNKGSIPRACMVGSRIGVTTIIADKGSMNVPKKRNSKLKQIRKTIGDLMLSTTKLAKSCGICCMVR